MDRPPHTTFWVTGFGAFPGVPANPTEQLIALLQEQPAAAADGRPPYHIGGTAVLEVSAVAARKWTEWLFRECLDVAGGGGGAGAADAAPAASNGTAAAAVPAAAAAAAGAAGRGPLVVLHLGVDSLATHFKLESVAANEATFRVPDQRGWQPSHALIDDHPGCGLDTRLATDLDVAALAARLAAAGHDARPSDNAGRYVCNFVYYCSLLHSQKARIRRGAPLHALFFHVPPATVVPIEAQLQALQALLRAIAEQLAPAVADAAQAAEAAAEPATAAATGQLAQLSISSVSGSGPGAPAAAAAAAATASAVL